MTHAQQYQLIQASIEKLQRVQGALLIGHEVVPGTPANPLLYRFRDGSQEIKP